jgi:hypothetical protein
MDTLNPVTRAANFSGPIEKVFNLGQTTIVSNR